MVQKKGSRKKLYTAGAVLAVLLLFIGAIAVVKAVSHNKADPYATETPATAPDDSPDPSSPKVTTPQDTTTPGETSDDPVIDPATVNTIDIPPMSITVSYVKGIGGFQYQVHRTANGTQYVEFSSSDLAGTKCTNDIGVFASILESPEDDDSSALAKTTTVEGTKYGLSLADSTCTSNAQKLQAYQKSFSDAFSLLKKMN